MCEIHLLFYLVLELGAIELVIVTLTMHSTHSFERSHFVNIVGLPKEDCSKLLLTELQNFLFVDMPAD